MFNKNLTIADNIILVVVSNVTSIVLDSISFDSRGIFLQTQRMVLHNYKAYWQP